MTMTDTGTATAEPARGGELVYADYVRELVELQERYKASMEQRALAVITTSSTIAALLFGFTTLARGPLGLMLPPIATLLLACGVVAFAVAAAFAIRVNAPRAYEGPKTESLRTMINNAWDAGVSADHAAYQVAEVRLRVLQTAKTQNAAKAGALSWAIRLEVTAVALLAAAIFAIAIGR
jgi:hypothetical protein